MLDNIKNKIKLLAGLYKTYRQRAAFQNRLQTYVDYITRQAAYERRKYGGRILDYGRDALFVGVLRDDWLSQPKSKPAKKDE
jgi:hypothetical protein